MVGVIQKWYGYCCRRCGNRQQQLFSTYWHITYCQKVVYCRYCTSEQQSNSIEKLLYNQLTVAEDATQFRLVFPFQLSCQQRQAANQIRNTLQPQHMLALHAVCGAGKTEILVAVIAYALKQGQRICWTIARKDVVIEIAERLNIYFPHTVIKSLYQGSPDLMSCGQITVCTTARLFSFYRFFDLLIVDENDALSNLIFFASHEV